MMFRFVCRGPLVVDGHPAQTDLHLYTKRIKALDGDF